MDLFKGSTVRIPLGTFYFGVGRVTVVVGNTKPDPVLIPTPTRVMCLNQYRMARNKLVARKKLERQHVDFNGPAVSV